MNLKQNFNLPRINHILVVVIFCLGFSACATTVQLNYLIGTHIDDIIAVEGEASEVYYDEEKGNVYVWEAGTFGDVPRHVSLYASEDGMITGWEVFIPFSEVSKLWKPRDDTNQEKNE